MKMPNREPIKECLDISGTLCYPPGSYSKQNYFPCVEFLGFIFDFWYIKENYIFCKFTASQN